MRKIPYGESSFKEIIKNDMYYVDKTMYIEKLELLPKYQFFIRPRRFGKSLFSNMLGRYYDIYEKDNFNYLFRDLYVEKNPTAGASKYLILEIDFSTLISDMGKEILVNSFDTIIQMEVGLFFRKYEFLIGKHELPTYAKRSEQIMKFLETSLVLTEYKVVVLIDEYDNYANTIMNADKKLYYELVGDD